MCDSDFSSISEPSDISSAGEDSERYQCHAGTQTEEAEKGDVLAFPTVTVQLDKREFIPLFNLLITLVVKRLNRDSAHKVSRGLVKKSVKHLNKCLRKRATECFEVQGTLVGRR